MKDMASIIPNLQWYISISEQKGVQPRCPFATVSACPRFYQSLALLGEAGSTRINPEEDQKLLKHWQSSDLWPTTREYATSISGAPGEPHIFSNFCPEVAFDRFGYFASYLARYADEIDIGIAHERLGVQRASSNDWRWAWVAISEMHYTECPLYSLLIHRSDTHKAIEKKTEKDPWYKRPLGQITIASISGLILYLLTKLL
ncbi:MAG: hypothetical protein WAK96_14140 [Desulfobaccales bacterium]